MPSRWFVPVPRLDPDRVRLEHVHAAFSAWFDHDAIEHAASDKPYTISPLTRRGDHLGVQIATLTADAHDRLHRALEDGKGVRLGNQIRHPAKAGLLHAHTWPELAAQTQANTWTLQLQTPTTFRSGDRSSPLPSVDTIMAGLSRAWQLCSDGVELPAAASPGDQRAVWVSDIDLRSTVVRLRIGSAGGTRTPIVLSAALGTITIRCDDPRRAARVGPLMHLAPYAGIGSMRGKGLGVVRLAYVGRTRSLGTVTDEVGRRNGVAG